MGARCGISGPSCVSYCESQPTALRDDFMVAMGECLTTRSCAEVKDGSYWKPCFPSAQPRVEPSAVAIDYCEVASVAEFECGSPASVRSCTESVKVWKDAVLLRAKACVGPVCDEMETCFTEA